MIDQNLGELLEEKVEGIDRLCLNTYQPLLENGGGVSAFIRQHRGAVVASTTLMARRVNCEGSIGWNILTTRAHSSLGPVASIR